MGYDKILKKKGFMVRMGRLELPRLSALEPKSSVSTNSTTSACAWQVERHSTYTGMEVNRGPRHGACGGAEVPDPPAVKERAPEDDRGLSISKYP